MVSDFDLLRGPQRFDAEFDLVELLARASGRPLSMTWLQRDPGGEQWKAIQARVEAAVAKGLPLYMQAAARGIGVINGLDASFHPFMGFPGYKEVAHLPLAQRAEALRDPARKARILAEKSERLSGDGTPVPPLVDILLARIELDQRPHVPAGRLAPGRARLRTRRDAELSWCAPGSAAAARWKRCTTTLRAGDGGNLVYFPHLQLQRRQPRHGAPDAGAPTRLAGPERRRCPRRHRV
jgi:hypothetical protein